MLYLGVCRQCMPVVTIIGWATKRQAWAGVHHAEHSAADLSVFRVKTPALYETQKAIEGELHKIARAGGYRSPAEVDIASIDPAAAARMSRLFECLSLTIESMRIGFVRDHGASIARRLPSKIRYIDSEAWSTLVA